MAESRAIQGLPLDHVTHSGCRFNSTDFLRRCVWNIGETGLIVDCSALETAFDGRRAKPLDLLL